MKQINNKIYRIRRSAELNRYFREKKSVLRLVNLTRWTSAFAMLLSVKRAYSNNLFDDLEFPVRSETIDIYLEIFKHAAFLSLEFQSNHSTIADLIPGK
jgi:hypothetical protein